MQVLGEFHVCYFNLLICLFFCIYTKNIVYMFIYYLVPEPISTHNLCKEIFECQRPNITLASFKLSEIVKRKCDKYEPRTKNKRTKQNQTRKTKLNKKRQMGKETHSFFHGTVNSQPMDSRDPFNLRTSDIRTVLCHFRK